MCFCAGEIDLMCFFLFFLLFFFIFLCVCVCVQEKMFLIELMDKFI